MAKTDYESEYRPSTLVPDYPLILERWARDAAQYRAVAPCELAISYGDTARQALDIFLPQGEALALFVHGGWWRMLDRSSFSHMARGLNAHGVAVAVASYDLCPQVSIGEIVEQMRRACRLLAARAGRRIVVFGHSAGGHLAATLAATSPDAAAGMAISGVFDLEPLLQVSMNEDFRLDRATARALSPLHFPPAPAFDCVVGALESSEFRRQSRALAERWGASYREAEGANHFSVLDPLCDPKSAMVARLREICAKNFS